MYRRLATALAATALGATALVSGSAPAQSLVAPTLPQTTCYMEGFLRICEGGRIVHVEDDGYDEPIIVWCNYGDAFTAGEPDLTWAVAQRVHENSDSGEDCGIDTDVVYVRPGEEIWCMDVRIRDIVWEKRFDAHGPHKINDFFNEKCVVQMD